MCVIDIQELHQTDMRSRFLYLHYGKGVTLNQVKQNPQAFPERHVEVETFGGVLDVVDRDLIAHGGHTWFHQFNDLYTRYAENHPQRGSGKPRTAYSILVSPNPEDNITQKQLSKLCRKFLEEHFPNCTASIVYHNDNDERLLDGKTGILSIVD